jgi:hypothetical protein
LPSAAAFGRNAPLDDAVELRKVFGPPLTERAGCGDGGIDGFRSCLDPDGVINVWHRCATSSSAYDDVARQPGTEIS